MALQAPMRFLLAGAICAGVAFATPMLCPLPEIVSGFLYGVAVGCLFAALLRWRLPAPCDTGTPALRSRCSKRPTS